MIGGVWFGLGDVLFYGMLLWAVLVMAHACVSEHVDSRRREECIRAAQALEIGDGVTLLQGVQAYFGEEGLWFAPDDGLVCILAGTDALQAHLYAHVKTGRIEIINYNRMGSPENEEARQALVGLMVQAAKKQSACPKT